MIKSLIMVGGGIQHLESIRLAQSMGYKVIVTDRYADAYAFDIADYTAVIDGRDIESLIAFTMLNKEKLNIRGVFTLTELVTSVSAIANACDLPGVHLACAVACQNKELSKRIWQEKSISTPKGRIINTLDDAKFAFNELAKDVFVKANIGFGGVGARRISSFVELEQYIENKTHVYEFIMEEYIHGTMHDVNAFFDAQGVFHPLGAFDRYFMEEAPVEIGGCYPSQLDIDIVDQLYSVTEKAARALGINWGPVKADLVVRNGRAYILEMAPRLHGPKGTLWLTRSACKNPHMQIALSIIAGEHLSIDLNDNDTGKVAIYRAILPPVKRSFHLADRETIINLYNLDDAIIFKSDGYIEQYENSTHVPGYVFASSDSYLNVKNVLTQKLLKANYEVQNR